MIRRRWAKRGHRPVAEHRTGYEWLYIYGFVHPQTGRTDFLVMPTVNIEAFGVALAAFKTHVDPKGEKLVVLMLDNAAWHTSKRLVVPEGVHLLFTPPYTPELQPAERLWPLVREAVANRLFEGLADLQATVEARCVTLGAMADFIRGATGFGWLPQV